MRLNIDGKMYNIAYAHDAIALTDHINRLQEKGDTDALASIAVTLAHAGHSVSRQLSILTKGDCNKREVSRKGDQTHRY